MWSNSLICALSFAGLLGEVTSSVEIVLKHYRISESLGGDYLEGLLKKIDVELHLQFLILGVWSETQICISNKK